MNKNRTTLDTAILSDCSHSHISKTCHHRSSTNENRPRNNHNNDFIQYDKISPRKRRMTSLIPIYINNILLILIRLMVLFIAVLIVSCTFYYAIVYISSKPKRNGWDRIIDWLFQE